MNRYLLMLVFLLSAVMANAKNSEEDPLFPVYIVDAEVINVVDDGQRVNAEMKVSNVLYGPDSLSNLTFRITASSSGFATVGALSLIPPLTKGEHGIWPVQINKEGSIHLDRVTLLFEESLDVDLPCRWSKEKKRCEEVVELAKTIKAVSMADPEKREKILNDLTSNKNALIQSWLKYVRPRLIPKQ